MIANIYDVAHGFTAFVRDEVNGYNMLLDCGYNEETSFYPTDEIRAAYGQIHRFFVLNYDEDHLDGLPRLVQHAGNAPFSTLSRNPLTAEQILSMKTWPYGAGMKALIAMMGHYTSPMPAWPGATAPEVQVSQYFLPFPTFSDTNNLSQVVFVRGPHWSIVFPGDLEKAGWNELLKFPDFRSDLSTTRIFVASHHGRESGYCEDVFKFCKPDVVIISDEPMQYDSQEHSYGQHATGILWGGKETRRVLTTRCDGHLRITGPNDGGGYFIQAQKAG
jgi:beta-lactamase superfamily II metal-dependent hydrolase